MLQLITFSLYGTQANTFLPDDRSQCAGKCPDIGAVLADMVCADGEKMYVCKAVVPTICAWTARDCEFEIPDVIPDRFKCPEITCPVGHPLVLGADNCQRCARFVDFATCCEAGCTPFDGCNTRKCFDDGRVDFDSGKFTFCPDILTDSNKLCICGDLDIPLRPNSTKSATDIVKVKTWVENKIQSKSEDERQRIQAEYEAALKATSTFVAEFNARQQTTSSAALPEISPEQLQNFDVDQFKTMVQALWRQQEAAQQAYFKSKKAYYIIREKYGVNTTVNEDLCAPLKQILRRDCKQVLAEYSNLQEDFDKIPEKISELLGNLTTFSQMELQSFLEFSGDQIASTATRVRRKIQVVSNELIKVDKIVKRTICRKGADIANSVSLRRLAKHVANTRNATARQIFRRVSTLVSKPIQNLRQYCRAPDNTPLRFKFKRFFTQWLITGNYSDARQAFERIKAKFGDVSDNFCDDCQCGNNETSTSRCLAFGENCNCLPQVDSVIPNVVAVAQLPNKTIQEIRTRLAQTFERLGNHVQTFVKLTKQDDSARRRLGASDSSNVYKVEVETQQTNFEQKSDVNTEADTILGQYGAVVGTEEQDVEVGADIKVMEENISPQQSSTTMGEDVTPQQSATTSFVPVSGASSIAFAEVVLFAAVANIYA